jgi:hypothetical protein
MKGYEARMNYGYTYRNGKYSDELLNEYKKDLSIPGVKEKYDDLVKRLRRDSLQFGLGGPMQTMITGTLGFILILFQRKKFYRSRELTLMQWIIIFICLFWLRQLFNFIHQVLDYIMLGYIPSRSDEVKIALYLDWNKLSISVLTAAIAAGILWFIVFRIIPAPQRLSFMVAGIIGGLLGFYLWLHLLGPVIMP